MNNSHGVFVRSVLQENAPAAGIFQDEPCARFLICMGEIARKCLTHFYDHVKAYKPADFAKCMKTAIETIRQWGGQIQEQEASVALSAYPDLQTVYELTVLAYVREIYKHQAGPMTTVQVKFPYFRDFLHVYLCALSRDDFVLGLGYFDPNRLLERRQVHSDALRTALSTCLRNKVSMENKIASHVAASTLAQADRFSLALDEKQSPQYGARPINVVAIESPSPPVSRAAPQQPYQYQQQPLASPNTHRQYAPQQPSASPNTHHQYAPQQPSASPNTHHQYAPQPLAVPIGSQASFYTQNSQPPQQPAKAPSPLRQVAMPQQPQQSSCPVPAPVGPHVPAPTSVAPTTFDRIVEEQLRRRESPQHTAGAKPTAPQPTATPRVPPQPRQPTPRRDVQPQASHDHAPTTSSSDVKEVTVKVDTDRLQPRHQPHISPKHQQQHQRHGDGGETYPPKSRRAPHQVERVGHNAVVFTRPSQDELARRAQETNASAPPSTDSAQTQLSQQAQVAPPPVASPQQPASVSASQAGSQTSSVADTEDEIESDGDEEDDAESVE